MGESLGLPRINEVVYYLDRFAPEVKASLLENSPELRDLLQPGRTGGNVEATSADLQREGLIARAQVLDATLKQAIVDAESDLRLIAERLARLKTTRFAALVSGAVASSGVLATALSAPVATLVAGGLALAASLAGLAADNLILGQKSNEAGFREAAGTFSRVVTEGSMLRKLLSAISATSFDPDEMKLLLADANALFQRFIQQRSWISGNG